MADSSNNTANQVDATTLAAFFEDLKQSDIKNAEKNRFPPAFLSEIKISNKFLKLIQENSVNTDKKLSKIDDLAKNAKAVDKANEKQQQTLDKISKSLGKSELNVKAVGASNDPTDKEASALAEIEVQPVKIVEIDDSVYKKFSELLKDIGINTGNKVAPKKQENTSQGNGGILDIINGMIGSVLKGAAKGLIALLTSPITLFLAGIITAISGIFDSGPFKGIKKTIGDLLINLFSTKGVKQIAAGFLKFGESLLGSAAEGAAKLLPSAKGILGTLAKKFGGFLLKGVKFIPLIGPILSIGFAISRMIKGDYVGGLIDLASGIVSFIPVVGPMIGLGIDLINAYRDVNSGGVEANAKSSANQSIKGVLSKAGDWIKKAFLKFIEFSPGFGTVYQLNKAITLFQDGNMEAGFKQLAISASTLIPGLGSLVGLLLDSSSVPEDIEGEIKTEVDTLSILLKAKDYIYEKTKGVLTTVFGTFKKGWEFIKNSSSEGIVKGVSIWSNAIPGLGWLGSVVGFISSKDEIPDATKPTEIKTEVGFSIKKLFNTIKDSIKKKFKSLLDSLRKLSFVPNFVVDKISSALGLDKPTEFTADEKIDVNPPQKTEAKPDTERDERYKANERRVADMKRIESRPVPPIPVETLATIARDSNKGIEKRLEKLIELMQPLIERSTGLGGSAVSQNNAAALSTAIGGTTNTSVFTNNSDRDIPYITRNKYREQMLYQRGLV